LKGDNANENLEELSRKIIIKQSENEKRNIGESLLQVQAEYPLLPLTSYCRCVGHCVAKSRTWRTALGVERTAKSIWAAGKVCFHAVVSRRAILH